MRIRTPVFHAQGVGDLLLLLAWAAALFLSGWAFADGPRFTDEALRRGIDFQPTDGRTGRHLFPEFIGQGVAAFDYDRDGWVDLYFVNARSLVREERPLPSNRLYRNRGDGTFEDVTKIAGVGDTGYGHGVAVGDVDNDGWPDLLVTNFGPNRLYRNQGDGTFQDVTDRAGVAAPGLNTSAVFFDYDQDGDLDLYIARYATYRLEDDIPCTREGISVYCEPDVYPGDTDRLFQNRGDGTFEDVTQASGIGAVPPAHGFGVVTADFDGDGWLDLYVANDRDPNYLFLNQQDGTFREEALFAGVALSAMGKAEAGMGVAAGDFDNDGDPDLIVTNFQKETNATYRNDGNGFFTDVTASSGVGAVSLHPLGWGVLFADLDRDGWKDLYIANGHVQDNVERFDPSTRYPQRDLLLRNESGRRFRLVSPHPDSPLAQAWPSRGVAAADLDNDGDLDLIVTNQNTPPNLLINVWNQEAHWLGVVLERTQGDRAGVGSVVRVSAGGTVQTATVGGGGSYLSHNDLRLLFGLGPADRVEWIEVRWLGGAAERWENLPIDRWVSLREGSGRSKP